MQEPSSDGSTKESRTIVENEREAKVKVKQGIEYQNDAKRKPADDESKKCLGSYQDYSYALSNSFAFSRLCNQGLHQFLDNNSTSNVSAKSFGSEFAALQQIRNNGTVKHDRYNLTNSRNDKFYRNKFDPQISASVYGFRPQMQQSLYLGQRYNRSNKRNRKWHDDLFRSLHQPAPWQNWNFRPELGSSPYINNNLTNYSSNSYENVPKSDIYDIHGQLPTISESIKCTVNGCCCDSFTPGKRYLRCCDKCHHGWVPHALARLSSLQQRQQQRQQFGIGGDVACGSRREVLAGREDVKSAIGRVVRQPAGGSGGSGGSSGGGNPDGGGDFTDFAEKEERPPASETVEPTAAFDVASLVLYGSRALPIRLKILLDQLFNQLPHAQVTRLLAAFGWTHEDYTRGYILQDSQNGPVLDRWSICSAEEEPLVLQQFLRFAETRPFVQQLLLAASTPGSDAMSPSRRPSPPTMPLAHLPPPLHLLHCGLPPPGSRLPPPLPPPPSVSHPSLSPTRKHFSTSGITTVTNSPPRSVESNNLSSPLNRLQSMQPFDFRKLSTLGLPAFPPMPAPPVTPTSDSRQKSMRHPQSPHSPSQLRPPVGPPVAPVSSSALTFGHPLAVAVSSGALPPSFPGHFPPPHMGKLSGVNGTITSGLIGSMDAHSFADKNSELGSDDDDDDDDENSGSALNLSRRDSLHKHQHEQRHRSLSMQAAPLGRPSGVPGRKPHSPGKRHQWGASPNMPPNLGTPFINPATGKKRVQCNVCLKTFCDKGALKIHFSAVHLREMHQCTVKGCSMMFSSRRSRNRHSANPNPKLHSPHLRRKISPHDGRSSMAHALVLPPQVGLPVPPTGLNHLPFGSFPLLTPPPDLRSPASLCSVDFKHLDLSSSQSARSYEEAVQQRMSAAVTSDTVTISTSASSLTSATKMHTSSTHASSASPPSHNPDDDDDDDDDDDGGIVVVAEDDNLPMRLSMRDEDDQPADFSLAKRPKLYHDEGGDEEMNSNVDSNEDNDSLSTVDQHSSYSINPHSVNTTFHHNRGVRKRKSQHPTRCAMPTEVHSSSTDGDSSNDAVFQEQPEDMSMSRLEAEERKKTPSPVSQNHSTGDDKNRYTPRSEKMDEDLQDEPKDLSSKSRSPRQKCEPKYLRTSQEKENQSDSSSEVKIKVEDSGGSSSSSSSEMKSKTKENGRSGTSEEKEVVKSEEKQNEISEKKRERRSEERMKEAVGGGEKVEKMEEDEAEDEEEEDEEEEQQRKQEGERPDDSPCAPSSIDSHPTTADDLSLDSSNALRQLESLSQGRMPFAGIQETSRSGRASTSPVSLTMHQDTTLDNSSRGSRSSSASPSTAAMDTDSSLITYARYENGGFVSTQEVPLDRENPRRCTACGKVFQNHFGVKTHYQNVHLKLMHRCSVDGCNAAFPSKRSRDRHSANLNLHRKLLSTSSSPPISSSLPPSLSPRIEDSPLNPLLHNEFLARLYADAGIGALGAYPGLPSVADLAARIPPPHPLLLPPQLGATFPSLSSFANHLAGLNGLTQQHLNHLNHLTRQQDPDHHRVSPTANPDDRKEDVKCTIPGCERVFSSKAVRDAHCRDPQAHRDLPLLSSSGSS